jgi:regulation of enolase protein 1 (concanavalin A-like superfamily)
VVPLYLKISRANGTYTAYSSNDGSTWTALAGSSVTLSNLAGNALAGMAATSHNPSASSTVVYDNVNITSLGGCPAGFTCTDIGSPAITGSTNTLNNTYMVNGAGNDIWGTVDQMQLAYKPLTGDGTISARILSQTNTDVWAKAGVMIKESATAGATYVSMFTSPSNGAHMQYNFNGDQSGGTYTFPLWIRVSRTGNTFTASTSVDGNIWTTVGTTTLTMSTNAVAGLFVCSHNGGQLGSASFDNVTVTNP